MQNLKIPSHYFFQCPICWNRTLVAAKKMQSGSGLGCVSVCVCVCVCVLCDYIKPCFGWLNQQHRWLRNLNAESSASLLFQLSSPLPYLMWTPEEKLWVIDITKIDGWTSSVSRDSILRRIQCPLCASLQPRMHNLYLIGQSQSEEHSVTVGQRAGEGLRSSKMLISQKTKRSCGNVPGPRKLNKHDN